MTAFGQATGSTSGTRSRLTVPRSPEGSPGVSTFRLEGLGSSSPKGAPYGPDIPLPYVSHTFQPPKETEAKNAELIAIVPWLRGNGEWRNENRIRARHMGSDRGYKGLRYG